MKSGEVKQNDKLENARKREVEILNQLYIMDGKNRQPVEKLSAGDIGATLKLKYTETNDTLRVKGSNVTIKPISYPSPRINKSVSAVDKNDEEKLNDALKKIRIRWCHLQHFAQVLNRLHLVLHYQ